MTIDIPEEDHKRLKTLTSVMRKIILDWIHKHLYSSNTPNAKTLEAIEQAEDGKNLVKADDIEGLFKKMNI
jgi:hypothetical protein